MPLGEGTKKTEKVKQFLLPIHPVALFVLEANDEAGTLVRMTSGSYEAELTAFDSVNQ